MDWPEATTTGRRSGSGVAVIVAVADATSGTAMDRGRPAGASYHRRSAAPGPRTRSARRPGCGQATAMSTNDRHVDEGKDGSPRCPQIERASGRTGAKWNGASGTERRSGARRLPLRGGHGRLPGRGRLQRTRRAGQQLARLGADRAGRAVRQRGRLLGAARGVARPCRRDSGATASGWGSSGPGWFPTTERSTVARSTVRRDRPRVCRPRPRAVGDAPPLHPPGVARRGLLAPARRARTASATGPSSRSTRSRPTFVSGSPSTRSTCWSSARGCSGCFPRGGTLSWTTPPWPSTTC